MSLPLRSAVLFVAGLFCGAGLVYTLVRPPLPSTGITRTGGYRYINPLLSCDINEDTPNPGFNELRSALTNQINAALQRGSATRISIYVRDMNYGDWTGVNETLRYAPASLLKVPIMIASFKDSEDGSPPLTARLMLPSGPDGNASERIKPAAPLARGQVYTIQDLIQATVEQSDNNAMNALLASVATSSLSDVFSQFDVPVAPDETSDVVSSKDFMRFFRILYNGSYISKIDSQRSLEYLANTSFNEGLRAGIPASMPISHKFGEREILTDSGATESIQLHDCGIVYYPKMPYGICIMTEGTDLTTLQSVIASLSKTVYQSVDDGLMAHDN